MSRQKTKDQAPKNGATAKADDSEVLRRDIADTRRELGETVEELAAKADVKGQVKERVEEVSAQAERRGPQIAVALAAVVVVLLLLRRRS